MSSSTDSQNLVHSSSGRGLLTVSSMSMSMSMSSCITPCTQPRAFVLCEDDGERGLWETGCGGGWGTGGGIGGQGIQNKCHFSRLQKDAMHSALCSVSAACSRGWTQHCGVTLYLAFGLCPDLLRLPCAVDWTLTCLLYTSDAADES